MALTAFTGTITQTTLRANFDDKTSTLLTRLRAGDGDHNIFFRLASLASGADISLRSRAFTMTDDQEARIVWARVTDTGVRACGVVLTVDNGDTTFLMDNVISASLTTAAGTVDTRTGGGLDLRTVTGTRVRLLKGVRYRLALTNTSGATITGPLVAGVQLRCIRRVA